MALPSTLKDKLRLPLIAAPLFIISTPDLVIAQCKAGIVGSFPALNARPADQLEVWLERITSELAEYDRQNPDQPSAPFAVNQIVHKSNDRLDHDMEVCARFKVPIVISSLGARKEINDAVHAWGGIVLHDVIDNKFAKKAIEKGADGLTAAFMLLVCWAVATLNPSILRMIESFGGPVIAAILFLMPMYAIRRIPAMRQYSGKISNVFVTVVGLVAISSLVYSLMP